MLTRGASRRCGGWCDEIPHAGRGDVALGGRSGRPRADRGSSLVIDPRQLREYVVRPTLRAMSAWSLEAEELVLRTAMVESGLSFLRQHGGGPARGIWQIEPATHRDNWINWLPRRPAAYAGVMRAMGTRSDGAWESYEYESPSALAARLEDQLTWNLSYCCAHARIQYLRDPHPIPIDVAAQASYWKRVYNTRLGRGTESQFRDAARRLYLRD